MSPRRALNRHGESNEAGWQYTVLGLARLYGWRTYHAPDNRPSGRTGRPQTLAAPEGRGFPDLVLLRGPRLVVAELKAARGRLGPGQADWLAAFREVGEGIGELLREVPVKRLEELLGGLGGLPTVEAYLWRPGDWEDVQRVLGHGQARRSDLDPVAGA